MNHLDGSQRSPWCKFPLRSSEKAWILQTFSRMIHWRIFPWKLNMSPENKKVGRCIAYWIVPTIRGHVSFWGCITGRDDFFCYARELGVAPPSNLWISPMLAVYPAWVVIYILWTRRGILRDKLVVFMRWSLCRRSLLVSTYDLTVSSKQDLQQK